MQHKRCHAYLDTVKAITASKNVYEFYIGFTSQPVARYCSWYMVRGYKHVVILADWLTEKDGKQLEKYLQDQCRDADKRSSLWRKAHQNIKNMRYFLGATSNRPAEKIHSVYLVWS